MMDFALREEIRSCINDMKQTAKYLDQAADQMEESIQSALRNRGETANGYDRGI